MLTPGRKLIVTFFGTGIPELIGTEELRAILGAVEEPFRTAYRKRYGRDAADEALYTEQQRILTVLQGIGEAGSVVEKGSLLRQEGEALIPRVFVRQPIPRDQVVEALRMMGLIK